MHCNSCLAEHCATKKKLVSRRTFSDWNNFFFAYKQRVTKSFDLAITASWGKHVTHKHVLIGSQMLLAVHTR